MVKYKIFYMHNILAKTILSNKNGMNLYRGCQHGCIYCDSRSTCYKITSDFEDIAVKINSLDLLEKALKKKTKNVMIGTGSMSDPYIPLEKDLCYTQKALELILKYNHGATLITKSDLILRDLELLKKINKKTKVVIQMTLTTADDKLCKIIEPNVCPTSRRFEVLQILRDNNIPTVVWLCPLLPFINDTTENVLSILQMCIQSQVKGIIFFGAGLTLRDGNRQYFYNALDKYFPNLSNKYKYYFGNNYYINSFNNNEITKIFHSVCKKNNIMHNNEEIFAYLNEFPIEKSKILKNEGQLFFDFD